MPTETEALRAEVEVLKTELTDLKAKPSDKTIISTPRFLEFPGEPGSKALAWIRNAESTMKIGGFKSLEAQMGAVRLAMAKHVPSTQWFDNLKDTDKESWESFRAAYNVRWEIELEIYAKCELFLQCKQQKGVSVKQFRDECLDAVQRYFEGLAPEAAPSSGSGATTLKHFNEGYFNCVSHIRFVMFVNGLLPDIRMELKKLNIKTTSAVTDTAGTEIKTCSETHFNTVVDAACRIELSISSKVPTQTAAVDTTANDQNVAPFTYQGRGRSSFGGRGIYRGGFRSNFGYRGRGNRARGSTGPPSSPQSSSVQCWRCRGFNHYARQCPNPPLGGQPSRGRGTPWQRRPISVVSDPENSGSVRPDENQEPRFEEIETLEAHSDWYGELLSSQVTSKVNQSN